MATTNWGRLTVVDLRHELKQRGMSTAGKKADLVERLTTAESEQINHSSPTNDHGTEAQMPADTFEAADNDVKYPENLPEVDNGVTDKPASIETSELGEKSESAGETEPSAKAEPNEKSVLFEYSEHVEYSEQATESNPITESEHVGNPEPAVELESIEKPEPVTEPGTINNPQPIEYSGPIAEPKLAGEPEPMAKMESHPVDSTPAQLAAIDSAAKEHKDDAVSTMDVDVASPDLSKDARGRKRRSRTPPPSDDESSRKRARPEKHSTDEIQTVDDPTLVKKEVFPLDDDPSRKDSSYAKLLPDIPTEYRGNETSQGGLEVFDEDFGKVQPSIHPPTSALYIRNFMRPLKEQEVRDYLAALATPPGRTPDDSIIQSFFLDKVRSHVFIEFDHVAAAQRTRAQVHTKIWPEESTRKALWADFIPPERIPGWIDVEEKGYSRGESTRRWELIYEVEDGEVKLELIDGNDPENKPRLMGKPGVAIPTGPAKQFSGVEGAPSGPRGHGAFRDPQAGGSRNAPITTSAPGITFTPVSDHVVRHRLHNLRSLQTTDRYRKMGGPEDIFRYSFEYNDIVIDRRHESFIGVRRPVEPRRRDRNRNQHRPHPPRPRGGDRYVGGGRDRFPERDVPRSRFDNTPLPTFRGGGGGRNSGGGPRRPHYWNHR